MSEGWGQVFFYYYFFYFYLSLSLSLSLSSLIFFFSSSCGFRAGWFLDLGSLNGTK